MRWLRVYGLSRLLLVARRRRRVLSRLLLTLRRVLIALLPRLLLVVRQRLAVRTIELGVWRRLLTTPDSVCWDEGLGLGRNRREDALLGKALAVCAATIFRLVKARAADLSPATVSASDCCPLTRRGLGRCGVAHGRPVARVHLRGRR